MSQILVCGEALMDAFALADTATGMSLEARIGGSPLNVAIGLARLGQSVSFFGAISNGFLGQRLARALHDEGVDTSAVIRVDAPTTLGLVGVDEMGAPSYSFYGERCADRQLAAAALNGIPRTAAAIHVGSFAMVVEPIGSTLRALVEREHERTFIAYDPNVRLNVEPNLTRWRDVLDWMLKRAHLVKLSEEDLALVCPDMSADRFLEHALSKGVRIVVVTKGASGAAALTRSSRASVPAMTVPVVDTVGAGDTFQAALLTWLADNDVLGIDPASTIGEHRLIEALRFASTAASLTCSRSGADLPRRQELASALDSSRPKDLSASS